MDFKPEKYLHAYDWNYFFLIGLLNNILKTPIYYRLDVEAERLKRLSFRIDELEHILDFQEVCTKAVTSCLDKENRSDKEMSISSCVIQDYTSVGRDWSDDNTR